MHSSQFNAYKQCTINYKDLWSLCLRVEFKHRRLVEISLPTHFLQMEGVLIYLLLLFFFVVMMIEMCAIFYAETYFSINMYVYVCVRK